MVKKISSYEDYLEEKTRQGALLAQIISSSNANIDTKAKADYRIIAMSGPGSKSQCIDELLERSAKENTDFINKFEKAVTLHVKTYPGHDKNSELMEDLEFLKQCMKIYTQLKSAPIDIQFTVSDRSRSPEG